MIPQRIKLSGFLSYKDEQEILFHESPLWMLSGANGSGKSSIFDAVTFALFGSHRGGSQSALELINKESGTLAVEFDFTIDKQLYRVKRTVRRQKNDKLASTQQVMKFLAGNAGVSPAASDDMRGQDERGRREDCWEPVPDTTYKAKFDAWVKDKIGLDYETFTSSVLLLQGKSEKLLDSTPAGRASVLARIVDLERYQRLHARADDKRKELKGQLEAIQNQLSGLREVADDELTAAAERIAEIEEVRSTISARIDSLVSLETQARDWEAACKKLSSAQEKLAKAESVLASAVAIEKEYARLRELRDVLPAVSTIVTERGRIHESERKTERLTKDRGERADTRRKTEHALDQSRLKRDNLKKTLSEDETRQTALNTRLRELAAILEKVKQVEDADTEIKRLEVELKPLPADPDATVRKLQQEQERLVLLAQHVALLVRLLQDRSELTKVAALEVQTRKEEARLIQEGKQAKEAFAELEARAKAAREERAARDQAAAEARALAKQARELADEFQQLSGEKSCRACGQPLTEKHFAEEKKKRQQDAKSAETKQKTLADAAAHARAEEEKLSKKEAADREHLGKLRDQYKDAAAAVKQAAQDIKRLTDSCRQIYFALPDEFKEKIGANEPADWTTATYPDRHDITELSTQAHGLDAVKHKLRGAQDEARKVSELRAKLESARERFTRAQATIRSGDSSGLREEFNAKTAEEKAVASNIAATKKAISGSEIDVDRQQRDLNAIDRELTEINGKLELEQSSRKQSGEAVERAKKSLPVAWQQPAESAGLAERGRWQDEFDDLTNRGVEKKFTDLQAARGGLDSLRAEIAQFQQEVEVFPREARRAADEVRAEIATNRQELDARNTELLDAQRAKGLLDDYRRQRGQLSEEYKTVDTEFHRYKLLAELLGRDRLQRFLVRKAERQIVDYANAVLDRLSAGQLFLKLVPSDEGSTEKALELECSNRITGGAAINVAFLSGSQRFRVAVALALGIGQYASKQHRPIESVIIDEGFGCLDRNGRQVMIQELHNLRGHLQCILLVSHQEEFAEAFSDGYHFELHNGSTKVSRFVR